MSYSIGNKFSNILINDTLHPILDARINGDNFKYYSLQGSFVPNVPFSDEQLNLISDIPEHLIDGDMIYCESLGAVFILASYNSDNIKLVSPVINDSSIYTLTINISGEQVSSAIITLSTIDNSTSITQSDFNNILESTIIDHDTGFVTIPSATELADSVLTKNSSVIILTDDNGIPKEVYVLYNSFFVGEQKVLSFTSTNNSSIHILGKPPEGILPSIPKGGLITQTPPRCYITKTEYNSLLSVVIDPEIGYDNSETAKKIAQRIIDANIETIPLVEEKVNPIINNYDVSNSFNLINKNATRGITTPYRYEDNNGRSIDIYFEKPNDTRIAKGLLIRDIVYKDALINTEYISTFTSDLQKHEVNISVSGDVINIQNKDISSKAPSHCVTLKPRVLHFSSDSEFTLYFDEWNISGLYYSFDEQSWFKANEKQLHASSRISLYIKPGYGTTCEPIRCDGSNVSISGYISSNSQGVFSHCDAYVDARGLIIGRGVGGHMFEGCANLKYAPAYIDVVPDDYMSYPGDYSCMFKDCTSLIKAPDLLISSLQENIYNGMFENCTSLEEPPIMSTPLTGGIGAYTNMFKGCVKLKDTPNLILKTVSENMCKGMFEGCTALINAWMSLCDVDKQSYKNMFEGCSSLLYAPMIKSKEVKDDCYSGMFKNCTALIQAPYLPAPVLMAARAYQSMFEGCTSLVSPPELLSMDIEQGCYQYMFKGCTSLTSPVILPSLGQPRFEGNCYESMFENCTGIVWADSGKPYRIPSDGVGGVPDISSFNNMFLGNTGTLPEGSGTPLVNTTYYYTV